MTGEQLFDLWTPAASRWAAWAKPVLFATLTLEEAGTPTPLLEELRPPWINEIPSDAGLIVDLSGVETVRLGVTLAKTGWQPVPLFNGAADSANPEVLPTGELRDTLRAAAPQLSALILAPAAPPAFLLDADRLTGKNPLHPGSFDNRWMAFPQDFPSGSFLHEAGIKRMVLIQATGGHPREDLRQVLLRWQEAGIQILLLNAVDGNTPEPLTVTSLPRYRWFFLWVMSLLRFRRHNAGGFGALVPELSSGAG